MFQAIKIELLKSRRTHSFLISTIMMFVAIAWEIVVIKSEFAHPQLQNAGVFFNNQTVDCIILPIAMSIFVARIIGNEKEGMTFKLQGSNGTSIKRIFYQKLAFTMGIFFVLLSIKTIGTVVFSILQNIQLPLSTILIHLSGEMLNVFILACFTITLSMILKKQGLLMAFGFLGGFFGVVLSSKSSYLLSFLIPWIGSAYLAPYKFHLIDGTTYCYELDPQIFLRIILYFVFCVICYIFCKGVISNKEGVLYD